jgi:hypothetical protein
MDTFIRCIYFVAGKVLCVQKIVKNHCQLMTSLELCLRLLFSLLKLCTETIVTFYIPIQYNLSYPFKQTSFYF